MARMNLQGKTALITGAANGIGKATATALAKRGCHLILTDINAQGLSATQETLQAHGVTINTYHLDVADEESIMALAQQLQTEHKKLDLLVNNAGVALTGTFEQVSREEFNWLFTINFWGVVWMCRAFLPLLRQSDDARIVNISSVFGMFGFPGQVAYCASKFGVRGFSESLRMELEDSHIGVTVVHPGGIATSIATNARISASPTVTQQQVDDERDTATRFLTLDPAIAGETIIKGVERRKKRVLVGNDAKAIAMIIRLLPVAHWRVLKMFFSS